MNILTENESWIPANWDAPSCVNAGISTRKGGFSKAPFDGLNLARHVGDKEVCVLKNREHLKSSLMLENEPVWLKQIHENRIIDACNSENPIADGTVTSSPHLPCVILTADCTPVLICNDDGSQIGAIHVGWRGLLQVSLKMLSGNLNLIIYWSGLDRIYAIEIMR